ncbi:hypothetical protein D3C73_1469570 [compost metagenome]
MEDIAALAPVTVATVTALIAKVVVSFLESCTVRVSALETPIWKSTDAEVFNKFTPLNLELVVTRPISLRSSVTSS